MQFVCANLIGVTPAVLQQAVGRLLVFDTTITKQQALNNWLGTAVNTRAMIGAVVNNKYITGQCQGRVNNKHFVATGGLPTKTTRGAVNVFSTQPALPATPDSLGIKVGTRTAYVMSSGPDLWGVDGFGLPVQLLTASSIAGDLKSDVNAGRGPTASRYQPQPGSVSYYQTVMTCGIIQRGASADGSVINSFSAAVSAVKDAVIAKIVPSVTYIDAIRQDAWTQNSNGRINSGTLLAWGTINNDSFAVGFSPFELPVYIDETGDDEQPVLSWAGIQVDSRQGQNSILTLDIGQDLLVADAWTPGKRMSFTQNPQRPISVGSAVVTL